MNEHDIRFKKTALNIGTALLIFIGFYQILYRTAYWYFKVYLYSHFPNETIANIVIELSLGFLYCVIFSVLPLFACH